MVDHISDTPMTVGKEEGEGFLYAIMSCRKHLLSNPLSSLLKILFEELFLYMPPHPQ